MGLVFELEVERFLEEVRPRVGKTGSQKNDIRIFEVFHVELARITNSQLTVVGFGKMREPHHRVQICNIRVTLGVQVSHVLFVNVVGAFERQVIAIDVLRQRNQMTGQVLDHDDSIVGRHNECLVALVEELRPQGMRRVFRMRGSAMPERPGNCQTGE